MKVRNIKFCGIIITKKKVSQMFSVVLHGMIAIVLGVGGEF